MSITPQMIKDQEFQVKFRGCDPVEVKAYLEVVAEEFFELQERCRLLVDDLQAAHELREELEQQKMSLEASSDEARKMAEEQRQTGLRLEQKCELMGQEMQGAQAIVTRLEQEKIDAAKALKLAEARILAAESAVARERAEKEALAQRVALMEEQHREAKKDELDFKATLTAAQQFCDAMKAKSQQEAEQLKVKTLAEIEEIRRAAHAELANLPSEIRALREKREEARRILRSTLESYLQNLDIFPAPAVEQGEQQKFDDLFQKIEILEDGSLPPDALVTLDLDLDLQETSGGEGVNDLLSVLGADRVESQGDDDERI